MKTVCVRRSVWFLLCVFSFVNGLIGMSLSTHLQQAREIIGQQRQAMQRSSAALQQLLAYDTQLQEATGTLLRTCSPSQAQDSDDLSVAASNVHRGIVLRDGEHVLWWNGAEPLVPSGGARDGVP